MKLKNHASCLSWLLIVAVIVVYLVLLSADQIECSNRDDLNSNDNLDFSKFIVWGPGLSSRFNMPVRYFYVQLVDKQYQNVTKSHGEHLFYVQVEFNDEETDGKLKAARVYLEILDRHEGTYVVRFRVYQSYKKLYVSIYNNRHEHVADSPYELFYVNRDKCSCPEENFNRWLESMNCGGDDASHKQLELDMARIDDNLRSIDMNRLHSRIVETYNQEYAQSLCNYVILSNRVYRKCYGKHIDFKMFSDAVLLSLTRKVKLPDVEFFMNLGDWPLNEKRSKHFYPIISWCGSTDANDLVLPTYETTESVLEMMGRHGLDLFSVQANTGPKWPEKITKAFWRGRDSRQERLTLVELSKNHSDILDAGLTNMFFFTDEESLAKYGPLASRVALFDFFKYKYQLNVDGTVAAYRFPLLLASDSVVLKQNSKFYEHFYIDLKPYVHYIPVKNDLSDLIDRIKWAMENDAKVQEIITNARKYADEKLTPSHIMCYHAKFFKAYSKYLTSKVEVREGMEEVANDDDQQQQQKQQPICFCPKSNRRDDSEL